MARTEDGGNRIGSTYEALRQEIMGGRLAPGARLKPGEVAERLGVSIPVVREALTRLVGDRLVVSRAHQGFSVVALTSEHLTQHTEARIRIDGLAVRLATERGDLEWESSVVAALHRLLSTPQRTANEQDSVSDAWAAAHFSFHHAIVSGCGNDVLLDIRDQLASTADLIVHWAAAKRPQRDAVDEHNAIADAVIARDGERAASLLESHYQTTADSLIVSGLVGP
ncbi:GntR family transcriptional regulator [Capillimicrobium parvum]|uniref:HTH-type transcriptional repressor GlaR n=1 Tax=Capillimicrobium parvum TaxID=2884022 RepID=A0A9E6XUV0_9ACTN|nr:GntR family transcriptional regulator [Capillimicrobium parvum]UGS34523.1 HTH-type transcriptional repressor GlaR [Capillimicrobium parvum]